MEFVHERLRDHVLRPGTGRGPTLSRPPRARRSASFGALRRLVRGPPETRSNNSRMLPPTTRPDPSMHGRAQLLRISRLSIAQYLRSHTDRHPSLLEINAGM